MKKVLIVEDQESEFENILTWLELDRDGCEWFDPNQYTKGAQAPTNQIGNVQDGLRERLKEFNPNIVIFDLQLQREEDGFEGWDGWDYCKTLREKGGENGLGIGIVTSLPKGNYLEQWSKNGASFGWAKPWIRGIGATVKPDPDKARELDALAQRSVSALNCMKPYLDFG